MMELFKRQCSSRYYSVIPPIFVVCGLFTNYVINSDYIYSVEWLDDGKWGTGKDIEGISRSLIKGTILVFAWGSEEKYEKRVRIVSVSAKIQTVHLLNASSMRYRLANSLSYFQGRRVRARAHQVNW
jgi:hypothetical protein